MAAQRIDFLFQNSDGYGWSERYYYLPGGLTVPNLSVLTLLNLRLGVLSNDSMCTFIRMASGYTRSPFLFEGNYPASGSADGNAGETSGPDFVALVLRLQAQPAGVGRVFLRGVPEAEYLGDQYIPSVPYAAAMNNFTAQLSSGALWGVRTSTQNTPIVPNPVSNLFPLSPRGYAFTSATAIAGLSIGSFIRMHQASIFGYDGLKKITSIAGAGPVIYHVGGAAPQAADTGATNPFVTVPVYQTPVIQTATPERISRRSSGRFFGQRRGRRSTTLPLRQ